MSFIINLLIYIEVFVLLALFAYLYFILNSYEKNCIDLCCYKKKVDSLLQSPSLLKDRILSSLEISCVEYENNLKKIQTLKDFEKLNFKKRIKKLTKRNKKIKKLANKLVKEVVTYSFSNNSSIISELEKTISIIESIKKERI
jgi:hypothetical protein